jgi:dihydroorotase
MNVLLKSVKLIDPGHPMNNRNCDIYIENGAYKKIAASVSESDCVKDTKIINADGLCISQGWIDMRCRFGEPGQEQKETIVSGLNAAARGGFTGVVLMPSTNPPLYTRSSVEYIKSAGQGKVTEVFPAGCLTVKREGKEMAELYDMKLGGAVAFTDDQRSVTDSGVMLRLLQYAENIGAPVLAYADERSISGDLQANQSAATTLLGFKGSPGVAEEIAVNRDILLSEYSNVPIHFAGISTAGAVDAIRKAKQKGLRITAEVSSYHLMLTDDMLDTFDTSLKVKPPLRTAKDAEALRNAVADGTIDSIVSDHTPEDIESKEVEWDFSAHGIINLETSFAVMNTAMKGKVSLEDLISKLTVAPRKILKMEESRIEEGRSANFTIFDPSHEWTFDVRQSKSLSANTPFNGKKLTGSVAGVGNNNRFEFFL